MRTILHIFMIQIAFYMILLDSMCITLSIPIFHLLSLKCTSKYLKCIIYCKMHLCAMTPYITNTRDDFFSIAAFSQKDDKAANKVHKNFLNGFYLHWCYNFSWQRLYTQSIVHCKIAYHYIDRIAIRLLYVHFGTIFIFCWPMTISLLCNQPWPSNVHVWYSQISWSIR